MARNRPAGWACRGEIARVVANDEKMRLNTWAQIDQMMSETRNQLAEKYKTGF